MVGTFPPSTSVLCRVLSAKLGDVLNKLYDHLLRNPTTSIRLISKDYIIYILHTIVRGFLHRNVDVLVIQLAIFYVCNSIQRQTDTFLVIASSCNCQLLQRYVRNLHHDCLNSAGYQRDSRWIETSQTTL